MFQETSQGIYLTVKVTPKSAINAIVGVENDALKIRIAAPPEKGMANEALIAFLADVLKISKSAISIARGDTGRHKRILIKNLSISEIKQRLNLGTL